jgi:hypothetical protein
MLVRRNAIHNPRTSVRCPSAPAALAWLSFADLILIRATSMVLPPASIT